jgi:hypothetical protein
MMSLAYDEASSEFVRIPFDEFGSWRKGKLPKYDRNFKLFRASWRDALYKHYSSGLYHVPEEVNVHYEARRLLNRRLRYMFRSPVHDVYKVFKNGETGSYSPGWVRAMLAIPNRVQRMRYYGWLGNRKVGVLAKSIGVEFAKRTEFRRQTRQVIHPVCGTVMERKPYSDVMSYDEGTKKYPLLVLQYQFEGPRS